MPYIRVPRKWAEVDCVPRTYLSLDLNIRENRELVVAFGEKHKIFERDCGLLEFITGVDVRTIGDYRPGTVLDDRGKPLNSSTYSEILDKSG